MFSFDNQETDEEFLNYDIGNVELIIFGKRVYINPYLVSQAMKIPCRWGEIFISWKTPKLEKNQMANKICWKNYLFQGMV